MPHNNSVQVHKCASVGDALYSINSNTRTTSSKHSSPDFLPAGVDAASFNAAEKRKAEGNKIYYCGYIKKLFFSKLKFAGYLKNKLY